jgi:tetratricopeptide (TPR) repeat protein
MSSLAQVQKGTVRLQNSGKKPVSGVQILYNGAKATESDAVGSFRLVFAGKKPGDVIFMEKIHKQGYEVVNIKELEVNKISNNDNLSTDIILAVAGTLDKAKKEYYKISDQALLASFEKEKKALLGELKKAKLNQEAFSKQYGALQKNYEAQKNTLDTWSSEFARVNLDDAPQTLREAIELFKKGKINEAIARMEKTNILDQVKRQKNLKDSLELKIQEGLQAIQFQAKLYVLQGNRAKAETLFDEMLQIDSSNLEILNEAAEFYHENRIFNKALLIYPKIIDHPQTSDWEAVDIYGYLGDIYFIFGKFDKVLENYQIYSQKYNEFVQDEPQNAYYLDKLADSYAKIGTTYQAQGDFNQALENMEKCYELTQTLYDLEPEDVDVTERLIDSFRGLGDVYQAKGDLNQALEYFQKYNEISKERYDLEPNDMDFTKDLGVSYSRIGDVYQAKDDQKQALEYYVKYFEISKKLYDLEPNNIYFIREMSVSYFKLGEIYKTQGDLKRALEYFQKDYKLNKKLYDLEPNNVDFALGLAISYFNFGDIYEEMGDKKSAIKYYQEYEKLCENAITQNPDNQEFVDRLAWVQNRLKEMK